MTAPPADSKDAFLLDGPDLQVFNRPDEDGGKTSSPLSLERVQIFIGINDRQVYSCELIEVSTEDFGCPTLACTFDDTRTEGWAFSCDTCVGVSSSERAIIA